MLNPCPKPQKSIPTIHTSSPTPSGLLVVVATQLPATEGVLNYVVLWMEPHAVVRYTFSGLSGLGGDPLEYISRTWTPYYSIFQEGCSQRGMWSVLLYNFIINMCCEGQRNKMTKKQYYYYCSKPSLRVVAVRVLSVRPPTTIRHPSTTHNTQPLSTNHDWPSNRCHRKKSINSSVGGSSPKEFTKLFYDHCCVLPNHIPRLSLFLSMLHCVANWTRALLHFIDDGNGWKLAKSWRLLRSDVNDSETHFKCRQ